VESHTAALARAEPPRTYDPPHILWYFGAITAALTASATVVSVSPGARGTYQLLIGLVLAAAFAAGGALLLRAAWRVAGGVLVVASVAMVPAVGQAFERLIGVWPDVVDDGLGVNEDFQGALFALALATAAAGLIAFSLIRFPFAFSTVTLAVVFAAQFLVAALVDEPTLDDRATCLIVTGAGLLLAGLLLDSVRRSADAFWWHAVGLGTLGLGLASYAVLDNADWAWISILVVGALLLLGSAPFNRATWATFGVLGVYGAALNYFGTWFGSWKSPALMVAVSVGLILLGIVLQLYARTWAVRLRRQAAPGVAAPPGAVDPRPAEPDTDAPPPDETAAEQPPAEPE